LQANFDKEGIAIVYRTEKVPSLPTYVTTLVIHKFHFYQCPYILKPKYTMLGIPFKRLLLTDIRQKQSNADASSIFP